MSYKYQQETYIDSIHGNYKVSPQIRQRYQILMLVIHFGNTDRNAKVIEGNYYGAEFLTEHVLQYKALR